MSSSSPCRKFSLDEIKEGTNNFDEKNVIGHGGEGKVYLAEIHLGSENEKLRVAVKHLKENSNEFEKEIETVTNIQHPHLVSLLGYCDESNEKILIYEYMEKGSLSDYVKRNSASICLSWKQRLNICLGAARGLQYLHKETDEFPKGIIHRDVKPANILLGENWVAKVSDFGTFKLSIAGQISSAMVTNLKGTCGYYAPEYFRSFRITRKIDVFSFGVVLFEVLCGKKPWERGDESYYVGENEDLGLWAQENVDTKIKTEISYDSLNAFTDILGRSLRPDPNNRPTMDDVILALKNALKHQEREEEQILKVTGAPSGGDIRSLIPRALFEQMLLHRNDNACPAKGFYTYDAFIAATKVYPNFASVGDTNICKREIAAFFAQTSHETTGGWPTAPDGPYAWGYCYLEEATQASYCEPSAQWPCAPGKSYHGRGPIQISYNYNYGPAGQALGLDLLNNPELVSTNPTVSFETALWFWMTTQPPKPSCHDVITNNWTPSQQDVSANRLPGYGVITNIINGGLECGRGTDARVQDRIGFYKRYCDLLGVSYGDNLDCGNQRPFGSGFTSGLLLNKEI